MRHSEACVKRAVTKFTLAIAMAAITTSQSSFSCRSQVAFNSLAYGWQVASNCISYGFQIVCELRCSCFTLLSSGSEVAFRMRIKWLSQFLNLFPLAIQLLSRTCFSGGCSIALRWVCDGFPMALQWLFGGSPMALRWFSDGSPMGLRWLSNGSPMAPQWFPDGSQMALRLPSDDSSMAVRLLFNCFATGF